MLFKHDFCAVNSDILDNAKNFVDEKGIQHKSYSSKHGGG